MESVHYLSCLWPGLPELWWRGRMSSLPTAIGFTAAVNFVLVTRFLFPQLLPSGLGTMAFWLGLFAWLFLVVRNVKALPELVTPRVVSEAPDEFPAAHTAYLRGHWERAERLLGDVLAIEHRDPPALLLLAGVYRQTGRIESAELLLAEIGRLEVSDRWYLEIAAEKQRLDRAIEQERATEQNSQTDSTDSKLADPENTDPENADAADLTDSTPISGSMAA